MSLSRQTLNRLPKIKRGFIRGSTYEQMAISCGVHHRTIERDVQSWVDSGLFETWIKQEFLRLHPKAVKKDLLKAYDNICKLVGKMLTRKIETKTELKGEIKHRTDINILLQKYETIVERATNRNLQENHT
jgi:hypothetical protein